MFKYQILLFLGFLALASALNANLEKNFLVLPWNNGLSTQLFQTRNGIIAYSTDLSQSLERDIPHYVQIDLKTSNVTQILQDLPTACGQGPSAFDRLHYHVATYSLVYYCTNNNSILIIDPDYYNVQKVFSLNINETFQEVRITTDGYSVAILGLAGLFSQTPSPSHLIKLNLQTQTIANHIVFDQDLNVAEAVTAYASSGSNMFIMANIFNGTVNIANVYRMTLISNSYSLTRLATFNSSDYYTVDFIPEFYCVENLIVTNIELTLVILHQNGNILARYENILYIKMFAMDTLTFWRPVILSDTGSSDVYLSLANNTLGKISAIKQGYNFENQGYAQGILLALKDRDTNTLLFSFTGNCENLTITDLATSQVVYQTVPDFRDFMITDKTYSVYQILADGSEAIYIFDRETNAIIKKVPVGDYYYDQENAIVSYLLNFRNSTVKLEQIDLKTGNIYYPLSFNITPTDSVKLIHATNNNNFDGPQAVVQDITNDADTFLIASQTFGQVKFSVDLPQKFFVSTLAVDYDTLAAFYFQNVGFDPNITITEYHYDENSFVSSNSNHDILNGNIIPGSNYSVIYTPGKLAIIDMPLLNQTEYSTQYCFFSTFQNSTGNFSMVLSTSKQWGSQSSTTGILYDNQIQDLPGSTSSTVQAGTAGPCSYWVVNQVGSFGVVQFYNICNDETVSEISV